MWGGWGCRHCGLTTDEDEVNAMHGHYSFSWELDSVNVDTFKPLQGQRCPYPTTGPLGVMSGIADFRAVPWLQTEQI